MIHLAAKAGLENVVKYLVENGADVNAENKDLVTPLHLAVHNGNLNVVKYLANKGVDVNSILTTFQAGSLKGDLKYLNALQAILDKNTLNEKSKDGSTPLHLAVQNDHLNIVKFLIRNGVDVNAKNRDENTPFHLAARNGHLEVVKYLVGNGADVNARNKDGNTPLFTAGEQGDFEMSKYLVRNGVNVNVGNKYLSDYLCVAAQKNYLEIAKVLIKAGGTIKETFSSLVPTGTIQKAERQIKAERQAEQELLSSEASKGEANRSPKEAWGEENPPAENLEKTEIKPATLPIAKEPTERTPLLGFRK